MKKIVLTGGGTAGHVTPNLALIPELARGGWEIHYIGSGDGIEKSLIQGENITFHAISAGKLRRYFSLKNLIDPFKVICGFFSAFRILGKIRPNVLFSKGGFVSVPVVFAGKLRRVPIVLHESDVTPGLANKLSKPCAKVICTTFPETLKYVGKKGVHTGTPIRREIAEGSRERGLSLCGFDGSKPALLVIGGSQGARSINEAVRKYLPNLLNTFCVAHICGKGNVDESLKGTPGYAQFEYVSEGMNDLLALADVVVSRAGANTIFELLYTKKPTLLIPLPLSASRGDQIKNAEYCEKNGFCKTLDQDNIEMLCPAVTDVYLRRREFIAAIEAANIENGTEKVLEIINKTAKIFSTAGVD